MQRKLIFLSSWGHLVSSHTHTYTQIYKFWGDATLFFLQASPPSALPLHHRQHFHLPAEAKKSGKQILSLFYWCLHSSLVFARESEREREYVCFGCLPGIPSFFWKAELQLRQGTLCCTGAPGQSKDKEWELGETALTQSRRRNFTAPSCLDRNVDLWKKRSVAYVHFFCFSAYAVATERLYIYNHVCAHTGTLVITYPQVQLYSYSSACFYKVLGSYLVLEMIKGFTPFGTFSRVLKIDPRSVN